MWAAGVPRQTIDICAKIGLSIDYYSSLGEAHVAIAEGCLEQARQVARGLHSFCYDNMQTSTSIHVEQRPDGPPRVLTGTTMIIYKLRNATPEACELQPIIDRRNRLEEITFEDHVCPSHASLTSIHASQALHLVKILLQFSPAFASSAPEYRSSTFLQHLPVRPPPAGWKTEQFPLQTTTTAENTTDKNMEVWREAYVEQMKMNVIEDLGKYAIPSINDQATNSNIRGAQARRRDDISPFTRFDTVQLAPGMFHVLLNSSWYILNLHRGSAEDHGSLESFFKLLDKTRHGSEHPDYHALKATETQVLFGLTLHAWKVECGFPTLEAFAASNPAPQTLIEIAHKIRQNHAFYEDLTTRKAIGGLEKCMASSPASLVMYI